MNPVTAQRDVLQFQGSEAMSEPTRDVGPIQSQTPSRALGDDRERRLEQQRTWLLRRRTDRRGQREERRGGERRFDERRLEERRTHERRSEDRRLDDRPGGDRRVRDRRQADRRQVDRRSADRRLEDRRSRSRGADEQLPGQANASTPRIQRRRRGRIDDYA